MSSDWQTTLAVALLAYAFLVWAFLPRRSDRRVVMVCPCVTGGICGEHGRAYAEMKREAPLVNRERR